MASVNVCENIDTLKDLMGVGDWFGGRTVVFSGDFRHILPVVEKAKKSRDVIAQCIIASFWPCVKQLTLTRSIRVTSPLHVEWCDHLL